MEPDDELTEAWRLALDPSDPMAALAAVSAVRAALPAWEATLARQALADGASWARIGEALGTSRQAAWERLRPLIKTMIEADKRRLESEARAAQQRRRKDASR